MRRILPLILLALLLLPSGAPADVPSGEPLYTSGPDGRVLMGGRWLFRLDDLEVGIERGYPRSTRNAGWKAVSVPHNWNAGDDSDESMAGSVGWYRKDFTLPSSARRYDWTVRFESVNYRTRVWLNGRELGSNKGAYLPFEFRLDGVKRTGTNRLVVRVDNRRLPTDFPPSGQTAAGQPTGGWWNYGGISREVYLRRIDTVDWKQVVVRPKIACSTCDASVEFRVLLRNATGAARRVRLRGSFGDRRVDLGTATIPARGVRAYTRRVRIANPRLWSPQDPHLYRVRLTASGGARTLAGYRQDTGIRSIRVTDDGRLVLNGQFLNVRGVGLHEDTRERGFAITNEDREVIVDEAEALGATMLRTHYPMHPYMHEIADRRGLFVWSEIPVYSVRTEYLKIPAVRRLATKELRLNIEANRHHPSVLVWSIANELSPKPGPSQGDYIRRSADLAHRLDPTRPVGIAVAGYPGAGCQTEYAPLDLIGFNEYFGWYPGPGGQIFDRTKLSPYLDSVRECYPTKALMVTEFGFEANRDGPVEEKGTWLFQQDAINYHLGVIGTKTWLSGAVYWALREFRVRPAWDGGNPRPEPPIHQKGVVAYDGTRKPAWADLQRWFRSTPQFRRAGR